MTTTTDDEKLSADAARARLTSQRWIQLVIGIVCMVMIANYQYGWTNFVTPITKELKLTREAVQWTFTLFIAAETWLVPVEGYLVDRFSPRAVVLAGGVIAALGWVLNSYAGSMGMLVLGQVVAGIGAGAVYGTCVGNALKWFPERRGLAAGLTAAGFGAGSALTVSPIVSSIASNGYQSTFLTYGIGQGVIIFVLAWFLRKPDAKVIAALPKPATKVSNRPQYAPLQVLKSPPFWVMYVMFVLMAAPGLLMTANLAQIGEDWGIAKVPVALFGLTYTAVVFAQKIDRVLNGLTRPFFGWISDRIGRENTMLIAFGVEAIGIFLLSRFGHDPVAFVLLTGTVYFAWGEIYSLFPSTCADTYGWKYATTNAGLLYTAKGMGSLFVPLGTYLAGRGNWETTLAVLALMNLTAAILAIVVLKPMRRNLMAADEAAAKPSDVAAAAAQPARSKVPQASQPLTKAAPLDAPALAPSPAKEARDGEPAPDTKPATDGPGPQRRV
jgi:OFA family oxalate/formate antiporter-like MFS transporter